MTPPNDPNDPNNPSPGPSMESGDQPPYTPESYEENGNGDDTLERNRPSVGAGSGKVIVIAFGLLSVMVYILYSLFFGGSEKTEEVENSPTSPGIEQAGGVSVPPPPPAPVTPLETAPPPPPPPPPPPIPGGAESEVVLPNAAQGSINFNDKERQRRLKSNMMVIEESALAEKSREATRAESAKAQSAIAAKDPNVEFGNNAIRATGAAEATATKLKNLDQTIAQGKIIDAVLETAINTDLPGTLRAIVSRDIYPESSRAILIPKGSRLIGQYNTGILRGQKRVFIVWTRIIRPDGVDIAIGSPGIDPLGRAGVSGIVDNKYFETFSAAILTSLISVGVAVLADSTIDDPNTTRTNTDGSSTTTGSAGAEAASQSVRNLGDIGKSVVEGLIDGRPTISIDQGTRVNVFVNRDLFFPDRSGGNVFVQ